MSTKSLADRLKIKSPQGSDGRSSYGLSFKLDGLQNRQSQKLL